MISTAIDTAVDKIDFSPMGGKRVFLETEAIEALTDQRYLSMSLRQHLAACGGVICDDKEKADYIVEVRAGAIGTDRDEMLIGIPAFNLPSLPGAVVSGSIPEIPFVKRTKQRGVAKVAVFAYNKHTGRPVWASGNNQSESQTNNLWFAGTGPLTKGNIYEKSTFAGHPVPSIPWQRNRKQKTFADEIALFEENPKERRLSDPSPASEGPEKTPSAMLAKSESAGEGATPKTPTEPPKPLLPTQPSPPNPVQPTAPYARPYLPQPTSGFSPGFPPPTPMQGQHAPQYPVQ